MGSLFGSPYRRVFRYGTLTIVNTKMMALFSPKVLTISLERSIIEAEVSFERKIDVNKFRSNEAAVCVQCSLSIYVHI